MNERGFAVDFQKLFELAHLAQAGTVKEVSWKDFCTNYLIDLPTYRCQPFFEQWARRHNLTWRWTTIVNSNEQLERHIEFL